MSRVGNTGTFADRQVLSSSFYNGVDLMSYLRGSNNLFIHLVIYLVK
jgi:hypothetical protein